MTRYCKVYFFTPHPPNRCMIGRPLSQGRGDCPPSVLESAKLPRASFSRARSASREPRKHPPPGRHSREREARVGNPGNNFFKQLFSGCTDLLN